MPFAPSAECVEVLNTAATWYQPSFWLPPRSYCAFHLYRSDRNVRSLSWYEEEWYVQLSIFSHEHMRRKQYEYKLWVVGCRFQVFKINSRKNDGFILVKQKAEWRSMSPGFGIFFFVAQKGCNELRVHITFDTSASTNDDIPSAPQSPGSATSARRRL